MLDSFGDLYTLSEEVQDYMKVMEAKDAKQVPSIKIIQD